MDGTREYWEDHDNKSNYHETMPNSSFYTFLMFSLLIVSFCSVLEKLCHRGNDNREQLLQNNENTNDNNENIIENSKKIIDINDTNEKECIICFNDYKSDDKLAELECNHIYHDHCIIRWLQKDLSCPICRTQLN